jgi:hypothetical protein
MFDGGVAQQGAGMVKAAGADTFHTILNLYQTTVAMSIIYSDIYLDARRKIE